MQITQVRNATLLIDYAGTRFLIDPMLAAKGTLPAFAGTATCATRWSSCLCPWRRYSMWMR
jgi:L-ascorbate metabolism protein UlaG (beta-lactamase superfamily)